MANRKIGAQTVRLEKKPYIIGRGNIGGVKEGEGPLADSFDQVLDDDMFGEKSSPTNKFNSSVEDEVIKRSETIQVEIDKLKREKEERNLEKELISTSLTLLAEEERHLVELRYFSKPTKEWASIADELNQSVDNCIKVRKKVIEKLADYIL